MLTMEAVSKENKMVSTQGSHLPIAPSHLYISLAVHKITYRYSRYREHSPLSSLN